MLNYSIIDNKPLRYYEDYDGTYIYGSDLLSESFLSIENDREGWYDTLGQTSQLCVVSKEYIARPDLISLAFYKTDEYADVICKVNGLSNPFELNENMVLIIPDRNVIVNMLAKAKKDSSILVEEETTPITTFSQKSTKLKNQKRTPAEATIEDWNYKVNTQMGVVFY